MLVEFENYVIATAKDTTEMQIVRNKTLSPRLFEEKSLIALV